jgi:hypothetical protein
MSVDLKGAKKIGFRWAVWSHDKMDWVSVSNDKPDAPADTIFSIDSAMEMNEKGIQPMRRAAPPKPSQQALMPTQMAAPYIPPSVPSAPSPTVQRADKNSFFSLPSPEKLAEQQRIYQPPQIPQQPAPAQPRQKAQAPEPQRKQMPQPATSQPRQMQSQSNLPSMKPTRAEIITPAVAGGVAMGVIMGIPILNLCIPAWLLGGFLAIFLLLADSPIRSTIPPEYAARVGAAAGLVAAVVSLVVSFIAFVFLGDTIIAAAGGNTPGTMLALNAIGVDDNFDGLFMVFLLISRLVLFPLLGALGAVVYVKYGRK